MTSQNTRSKDTSNLSTYNQTGTISTKANINSQLRPYTANLLTNSIRNNNKMYKQKIQWGQSSSTWRHSTINHKFSKDKRFKSLLPYYNDILQLSINAEKCNKSPSFGKGRRIPIPQNILKKAKQLPAPNSYYPQKLDQQTRSINKGKSFAESWQKYEKVYLTHRKDVYSSHFTLDNPSAKYNVRVNPDDYMKTFSSFGKDKNYVQSQRKLVHNQQTQNKEKKSPYLQKFPRRKLSLRPWVS